MEHCGMHGVMHLNDIEWGSKFKINLLTNGYLNEPARARTQILTATKIILIKNNNGLWVILTNS